MLNLVFTNEVCKRRKGREREVYVIFAVRSSRFAPDLGQEIGGVARSRKLGKSRCAEDAASSGRGAFLILLVLRRH